MARSYANIFTAIWRDPEFRALSGDAQRVYLLLCTQPNISAAGLLPATIGRWAAMAADTSPDDIRAGLAKLAAARFVAADDVTEEVLVRSFVRHDNGYRNSKRVPVIRDAAGEIESRMLRRALAVELVRLELPAEWTGEPAIEPDGPPDGPPDRPSDRPSDGRFQGGPDRAPEGRSEPLDSESDITAPPQVDSLSHSPSDAISGSERVVVTKGPYVETPTHNPQPTTRMPPPSAAVARTTRDPRGSRIPPDFALTPLMRTWHREHARDTDIAIETANFVDHWQAKSGKDAVKRDWIAAWRTWMRNAQKWKTERAGRNSGAGYRPFTNPADVEDAYGGTL